MRRTSGTHVGAVALAALGLLAFVGCSGPRSSTSGVMATDSAGVEIVSNGSDTVRLSVREVLRIGVVDGGGPAQLSNVTDLAIDTEGHTFVGNGASGTIRVFDEDGAFLAEFGGIGRGPAEVSTINSVVYDDGSVAVVDWQRGGKVVLFGLDGDLQGSWPMQRGDGTRVIPIRRTPDGWLTGVGNPLSAPRPALGEAVDVRQSVHLMELASSDPGPEVYSYPLYTLYGVEGGEGGADWALFRPRSYQGFDARGRMFVTDPQSYRIDVHDFDGLRRSIRRPVALHALSGDDARRLKDAALAVVDTMSRIPDAERARERRGIADRIDAQARLPLPAVVSPLGDLLVASDGAFLVRLLDTSTPAEFEADQMFAGRAAFPADETRWDAYSPEGRYVGTVRLPARFRPDALEGSIIAGVFADALDVEYVVRLEVSGL